MSSSSAERAATGADTAATRETVLRLASAMLRPALVATLLVGVLALVGCTVVAGARGAEGSLAGTALVVACCWLNIAVMRRTASSRPGVVMTAAFGGYVAKFAVLMALCIVLPGTDVFDMRAFGISVLAGVAVWTCGELVGFVRAKVSTVTISNAPVSSS